MSRHTETATETDLESLSFGRLLALEDSLLLPRELAPDEKKRKDLDWDCARRVTGLLSLWLFFILFALASPHLPRTDGPGGLLVWIPVTLVLALASGGLVRALWRHAGRPVRAVVRLLLYYWPATFFGLLLLLGAALGA
ncbi:MAG: hypothetical protein GC185_00665 [Alphaproteobacteria bacterium]|nr:hypothetical protein [Alphaproteobacteria bacterium]